MDFVRARYLRKKHPKIALLDRLWKRLDLRSVLLANISTSYWVMVKVILSWRWKCMRITMHRMI